jgi:hypothetical protein
MSKTASVAKATGASTVALTHTCADDDELISLTCKLSSAPTTAGAFTITLDANAGTAYDTVLYSVDPSVTSATSIFWYPDKRLRFDAGDIIKVDYANADARTYGVQLYYDTNPVM